ncbi:NADP-dependent oxidoreductase [Nocardioides sp.]|uniref:NADP-dependent oxidoreductase n=1 Tax=Nocardioides sp. TaxID=35761 RepID=UPI0026385AA8|nr:NADP-dependent oxidoreductase [Nocardioides sp.]
MSRTTTAVRVHELGGPEVLQLESVELPDPASGEVQIDVRAIGVNPVDLKMREGFPWSDAAELPFKPGNEVAGVVAAVGPGVDSFAVGDEVVAFRISGGYAEAVNVPVGDVFAKPASLTWEEAAGLLLVGVTAVHALTKVGVGEGDRVLVHGASGSVGQLLIQLALLRGASVVGTAGPRNHDLLHKLGATPIAYGEGLLERATAAGPYDAAIDLVGTPEAFDVSLALVEDRSRITTIIGGPHAVEAGVQKIGGGPGSELGLELRAAARPEVLALAGAGKLHVRVVTTFPLAEVAESHRYVAEGHAAGKVILLP